MLGMAGSRQYWERGREQILTQSPKKGTACHHCDARLPEDCEQVSVGCLKSPSSTDCHLSSLEEDIHLSQVPDFSRPHRGPY